MRKSIWLRTLITTARTRKDVIEAKTSVMVEEDAAKRSTGAATMPRMPMVAEEVLERATRCCGAKQNREAHVWSSIRSAA